MRVRKIKSKETPLNTFLGQVLGALKSAYSLRTLTPPNFSFPLFLSGLYHVILSHPEYSGFFQKIILLLFNHSCLHLILTTPPSPQSSPPPSPASTSLGFVHVSFIVVPENIFPLPPFPPLSPPSSPLVTVTSFLISMSLVIFSLLVCFVDYVPVIGEIIWTLSIV